MVKSIIKANYVISMFIFFIFAVFSNQVFAADLFKLIEKRDIGKVVNLISKGADVNLRNNNGETPLILASKEGFKDAVAVLLVNGADVNAFDKSEHSALSWASFNGHKDIVELLVKYKADINHKAYRHPVEINLHKYSPLMYAMLNSHKDIAKFLINNGANINDKGGNGNTPLYIAVMHGDVEMVKLLLDKGADPNVTVSYVGTALTLASSQGNEEITNLLITHGANIEGASLGGTALMYAIRNNHKNIMEMLVNNGADVNARDNRRNTPLLLAVKEGKKELAIYLMNKGADIKSQNYKNESPIKIAREKGMNDLLRLMGEEVIYYAQREDIKDKKERKRNIPESGCYALKRKKLKVAMGTTLPPMHYRDSKGKLVGFEVDLVRLFAENKCYDISFIDPAEHNSTSLTMVISGKADMAVNAITITDKRKKWVAFSKPYFESGTGFLLSSDDLRDLSDFTNRTYLVKRNSPYREILSGKVGNIQYVESIEEAVDLIKNEKLRDYLTYTFVYDWLALREIVHNNEDVQVSNFMLNKEEYGVASKINLHISEWNSFLDLIKHDGRYESLYRKWFKDIDRPYVLKITAEKRTKWSESVLSDFLADCELEKNYPHYLTLLNFEFMSKRFGKEKKSADKVYAFLKNNYNTQWFPHLKEVFRKGHFRKRRIFHKFILDKDITDMLPELLSPSYLLSDEAISTSIALSLRHPELKKKIETAYENFARSKDLSLQFHHGSFHENVGKVKISVIPDGGKGAPVTFHASANKSANLRLLNSNEAKATRVKVNEITGTLQEMTIYGDTKLNIVSSDKGIVKSIAYPDEFKYSGMSSDRKVIYFDYYMLRFFMNVESEKIFLITGINPLDDQKTFSEAYGKMAGIDYYQAGRTNNGDLYYAGYDSDNYSTCAVSIVDGRSGKVKKRVSFLGCGQGYVLDDKFFYIYRQNEYLSTFNVVDLISGIKVHSDSTGAIIPTGQHSLYSCSPSQMINTQTLDQKKIQRLPCPGRTGKLVEHPKEGFFIYISWPYKGC